MTRSAPVVTSKVRTTISVEGYDLSNLEVGSEAVVTDVNGVTWNITRRPSGTLRAEFVSVETE